MTLTELRQAIERATPGPWEWNDEQALVAPGVETYVVNPWAECADDFGLEVSNADAHLIAHAPQWLQALVDVCEAAASLLDAGEGDIDFESFYLSEMDNLRAALDRLGEL